MNFLLIYIKDYLVKIELFSFVTIESFSKEDPGQNTQQLKWKIICCFFSEKLQLVRKKFEFFRLTLCFHEFFIDI